MDKQAKRYLLRRVERDLPLETIEKLSLAEAGLVEFDEHGDPIITSLGASLLAEGEEQKKKRARAQRARYAALRSAGVRKSRGGWE